MSPDPLISLRGITRTFMVPDSRPMARPVLLASPTASRSSFARETRLQKAVPWSYRSGAATFSVVVRPLMRLKDWKTNPKVSPRRWARRPSLSLAVSMPVRW